MFEISQKQHYIFRTNRLIENIGASHIIRSITETPYDFFNELESLFDINTDESTLPNFYTRIVGGGNATYVFNDKSSADTFAKKLSAAILRYLPGVELFLIQKEINWNEDNLYPIEKSSNGLMTEMRNELAKKKNRREHAVRQVSWGIHQPCPSSGLPAGVGKKFSSKENVAKAEELIIKEIIGEYARESGYKKRLLEDNIHLLESEKYNFFNHLEDVFEDEKNEEGKSYAAIVSIDGNAMGEKVSDFLNQEFESNDQYVSRYKVFSNDIDSAYTRAFRQTIAHLMDDFDSWAGKIYGNKLNDIATYKKYRYIIPLRPVVASGDDVSFITHGSLGVELSRLFLQYLQRESITINGKTMHFQSCAGVAIIRHKFPFWLGFELADHLCSNAKRRLKSDARKWRELGMGTESNQHDTSLIDWQLVESGDAILDIQSFRDHYYRNEDNSVLAMRPYYVQSYDEKHQHFASYEQAFLNAIQLIEQSSDVNRQNNSSIPSRSKWKQLRDVYHQGMLATNEWAKLNQFKVTFNEDNKTINHSDERVETVNKLFITYQDGFGCIGEVHADRSAGESFAYFYDAIEIIDYFIRLSEVK